MENIKQWKDVKVGDTVYFADEFIPQRPDFYCHPHNLSFKFSRIPEVVVEEPVSLDDVDKYVKETED